ncbi:MAG: hypothetical protein NTX25_04840 [Proteobacteria bacterium]|nr:hypothetical protein [Pseudomonadota bacterium]
MSISPGKVQGVELVWRSNYVILLLFSLVFNGPILSAAPSKENLSVPTCELISKGPGVALQNKEILLHNFLTEFLSELRSESKAKLSKFFHPRAKNTNEIGEKLNILLKNRYDAPWQFSIFRVWQLNVPNASKAIFDNCPESEGASLIGQFGYEKQFIVMIQVMGQNELGRLLIAIVPDKARLSASALRLQQWTQEGLDAEAWAEKAQAAGKVNQSIQAALAYDVAQKLLTGEDLIVYPQQKKLQNERDAIITQADLVKKFNELLKIQTIAYVGSMLAREGTGILIRERVESQEPTNELQERCRSRGIALLREGWLANKTGGIRCNYIFPGMDPKEDSAMGGFYLSHDDLINFQKK